MTDTSWIHDRHCNDGYGDCTLVPTHRTDTLNPVANHGLQSIIYQYCFFNGNRRNNHARCKIRKLLVDEGDFLLNLSINLQLLLKLRSINVIMLALAAVLTSLLIFF